MEFNRVEVTLNKPDDTFTLRPVGDVHAGNKGFDKEKFERTLLKIFKRPDNYTIGMGDYIDNVMAWANGSVDKRWNPETRVPAIVLKQIMRSPLGTLGNLADEILDRKPTLAPINEHELQIVEPVQKSIVGCLIRQIRNLYRPGINEGKIRCLQNNEKGYLQA